MKHGKDGKMTMQNNLVTRLNDWTTVYPEDQDEPGGELYLKAANRIEELERRLTTAVDALETIRFFSGVNVSESDFKHVKDSVNDVASKALATVK